MKACSYFRLKVQGVESTCWFELTWGQGQQITCPVLYPAELSQQYHAWQKAYLHFYKTALRGKAVAVGSLSPEQSDGQAQLVQAEAQLLRTFHHWLRAPELFDLRATLAQGLGTAESAPQGGRADLFLTCSPLALERLPWETWEIGPEFGAGGRLRIARTPSNLRRTLAPISVFRRRPRILAILGDETGLDFQGDRQALQSLAKIADIRLMGWQPALDAAGLKAQICAAIAEEPGWDGLFFAGHSNETAMTGGELAIAPHTTLQMSELAPYLAIAQQRGLKFALFNSCKGLNIANALIDLGLSQVAILREPIHNRVAHAFLVQFAHSLAQHCDVHDALLAACASLQRQQVAYPSAYLIPSLFCHPDATPFRIPPTGWQQRVKPWLPQRREWVVLGGLLLASLLPPVQDRLLDWRVGMQAIYREATGQSVPAQSPPILLVQIDEPSLRQAGISRPNPMDRRYLARLVTQLTHLRAKVVGIDYLLDRPLPEQDAALSQAIRTAIAQHQTWFIFAALAGANGQDSGVGPETRLASPRWSLQGNVQAFPQYLRLPQDHCRESCPFAYLMAVVQRVVSLDPAPTGIPQPDLSNGEDLRTRLFRDGPALPVSPLAKLAESFGPLGLRPINDFSIPPDQVYEALPAWKLLTGQFDQTALAAHLSQQVVLIAPGGYSEAGVTKPGGDNLPMPLAIAFWQALLPDPDRSSESLGFPGGQAQAYMLHSFLRQQFVIPVPEAVMLLLATIAGKGVALGCGDRRNPRWYTLGVGIGLVLYGWIGLQLYLSVGVLLPWLMPSVLFCFLTIRRKTNG
ncbi:MAG: CHASE2 domain-containing protein [Thermosynechococcaceae cyanobacterium]